MRITLKQLDVFVTLAKTSNMTRASETLHLTQSACSMALSTLEHQLGSVLFDRHGKKLILNERGKVLFPKAANILAQIKELQDLTAGQLTIGASTTIGNYLLPGIIGHFVKQHPHTKITLRIANTEQIIKQLLSFDIDIAMIEGKCYSDEIDVLPWKKDELIIIASLHHPLAKQKKITRDDLYAAKWILREPGSGTREKFEEATQGKISTFLELGHTEAVKHAVLANLGISCLSRTTVTELLKNGQLVELKTPFLTLTRDFYILIHKHKHKTTVLSQFIDECKTDLH